MYSFEQLNWRYQENDKLLKQLEGKEKKLEFLESFLTAVSTSYLEKFSGDERKKVAGELVKKLLNENK